jgi:hypothetical protein
MRSLIVCCFISFFGSSCEDDKNDSRNLIIFTGKECGWCGGADSLAITSLKSVYEFSSCDKAKDKEITEITRREEWKDLLSSLNWNDFKKVNVNTCALCADGCDTWIVVKNGSDSHRIKFTPSSHEIEPIIIFVEKLRAIHERYRQK